MSTPPTDKRPIVISGPSGVGKGTLFKSLFERHPDTFTLSVSHTTRAPRPGETPGVDYHYVSRDDFEALVAAGGFVEHAQFGSNLYGTSKAAIAAEEGKGKVVVLDIEMEGVKQVRASTMDTRRVFIAPPSSGGDKEGGQLATLEARLRGRGTESEDSIRRRLDRAAEELEFGRSSGAFDRVIVNDDLQAAIKELDDWVYAEPTAAAQ